MKSTETTKVSKNDDVAIFLTGEELSAFSHEKMGKAKVVSNDLKTMTQIYLCPVCSAPVSITIMQLFGVKNAVTFHCKVNAS